jgi:hypothetical protein
MAVSANLHVIMVMKTQNYKLLPAGYYLAKLA